MLVLCSRAPCCRTLSRAPAALAGAWSATTSARRPSLPRAGVPLTGGPSRPSSSNSRWKQRQGSDFFAREAKVQGLKSRAAFKLLEMDSKYKLFKRGNVVVDLGYAPGSWSQVAVDRVGQPGRVVGIDIIPAQPPKGVSTIQGNFLSPGVQSMVKQFLLDGDQLRRTAAAPAAADPPADEGQADRGDEVIGRLSYIDSGRSAAHRTPVGDGPSSQAVVQESQEKIVDVVLSDMSAPWPQTYGFTINSLSNPYIRMMNTSGNSFRDHAGSMDLCMAALSFASDTLGTGGNFVCKFYQGAEDKVLESRLKHMFKKVHREKPESSRSESKEAFFVALHRKAGATLADIGGP